MSKSFGTTSVVDALDFEVGRGEFVTLLGPSGSGKTTLLMMVAGFQAPTAGAIHVDGRRIDGLAPHRRAMGVVFQNYALFPHMSVADNLAFPLKMRRVPRSERGIRVARALDLVHLGRHAGRRPHELSGGEQQRVALARALVHEPEVVLMDEPFSALDKQLRARMQLELRDLHRSLGLTVLFVTHDQDEALTMSDRVAVLNRGRIEQYDAPKVLYERPGTRFVAEFVGETNLIEGTLVGAAGGVAEVSVGDGALACRCETEPAAGPVLLAVRPEVLRVTDEPGARNALPVTLQDQIYHGDHVRLHLSWAGGRLVARAHRSGPRLTVGARAFAAFEPADAVLVRP